MVRITRHSEPEGGTGFPEVIVTEPDVLHTTLHSRHNNNTIIRSFQEQVGNLPETECRADLVSCDMR